MIELARLKPEADPFAGSSATWAGCRSTSGRFDLITTGYGLRNVPDLRAALAEMHRVLAPGGRLCSLDFDRPESAGRARCLPHVPDGRRLTLGFVLHRDPDTYRYIPASIRRYPGARGVAALMREAGFENVEAIPVLGGFMAIHVATKPGRLSAEAASDQRSDAASHKMKGRIMDVSDLRKRIIRALDDARKDASMPARRR